MRRVIDSLISAESEIDVFPFTLARIPVQLCTHDKIAVVGGGAECQNLEYLGGDFLPIVASPP
jgi:hypothetical protein